VNASPPLLDVSNLTIRFGGLLAVDAVSFRADDRAITAIIGPNGAGKTTVFNCLTGFYRPSSGALALRHGGQSFALEAMPDHRIAAEARLARTFQNIRLFPQMTVLENLILAQHRTLMRASGYTILALVGLGGYARAERAAVERARFWLDRVGLLAHADDEAASLAYGDQRRLEIARAMCTDPVLLCLDEPAAGLNARETGALSALLGEIRDDHGVAILLIEHDMALVMAISDRIVVLEYGRKIADGPPSAVRADPAVIAAYLGTGDSDGMAAV